METKMENVIDEIDYTNDFSEEEMVKQEVLYSVEEINKNLSDLSTQTGMPVREERGQRFYGPPADYFGPPPPLGSEVFIGGIPRDYNQPDLILLFQQVGRVFLMRLMIDEVGNNKGYCFVQYCTIAEANRAIQEFNNLEICEGWRIGVVRCINRTTVFISDIPRNVNEDEFRIEMNNYISGIKRVSVPGSNRFRQNNRGFAFVEFVNHSFAMKFMAIYYPRKFMLWGCNLKIQWAERPSDDQAIHVMNVSFKTTEDELEVIFNRATTGGVLRVEKIDTSAIIHFTTRHNAKLAKSVLNNRIIDGNIIKIHMSSSLINITNQQNTFQGLQSETESSESQINAIPSSYEQNRLISHDHLKAEYKHKGFEASRFYNDNTMDPSFGGRQSFGLYGFNNNSCFPTKDQMMYIGNGPQLLPITHYQPPSHLVNHGYNNGNIGFGHFYPFPVTRSNVPTGAHSHHTFSYPFLPYTMYP